MKKKTKVIIGTIVSILAIAVLAVAGFLAYLGHTWNENHEFEDYVIKEGPWGSESTWVSDDGNSYLVSKMESGGQSIATVTAYFKVGNGWQKYELNPTGRIVSLDKVENGVIVEGNQGRMKFDGTTFTIKDLSTNDDSENRFGNDEYRYTITNEEFDPD